MSEDKKSYTLESFQAERENYKKKQKKDLKNKN